MAMFMLAVVLFPRFNMQDIALIKPLTGVAAGEMTPDQKNYYNFTEYFKGNKDINTVWAPFIYRPLMPFAASLLPFNSMLSMSMVNVIANLITLLLIYFTFKKLEFGFAYRIAGIMLYIISFPLLYYGSSGFLEPTANLFIYLIVYLTVSNKKILLALTFIFAALTKEVTILALPFSFVYFQVNNKNNKKEFNTSIYIIVLSFILFIATNILVRSYFSTGNQYLWSPSFQTAINNLSRTKTYLSFILGLGLPGILVIFYVIKDGKRAIKTLLPWFTSMLFAFLLSIYSVIAAYSDGRFIWTGYPFMIVISIYYLRRISDNNFISTIK
jgi:hypothetical protein